MTRKKSEGSQKQNLTVRLGTAIHKRNKEVNERRFIVGTPIRSGNARNLSTRSIDLSSPVPPFPFPVSHTQSPKNECPFEYEGAAARVSLD
jgi:hypothetical protein